METIVENILDNFSDFVLTHIDLECHLEVAKVGQIYYQGHEIAKFYKTKNE